VGGQAPGKRAINGEPFGARADEHRDGVIAVVGGVVLYVACAWWALKAVRSDSPPDAPDFYGLFAAFCFCLGAITLGPGLLSFGLLSSKPRAAQRLATFGRVAVVTVACSYVIGRVALMQLDVRFGR